MSVLHLDHLRRCDFCGRTEKEVAFLVESSDYKAHICDECVAVCAELLANSIVEVEKK